MSQTERHRRLENLFHQWVDLDDATRSRHLDQLAQQDPALHYELLALLRQSSQIAAGERALDHFAQTAQQLTSVSNHPTVIGPYTVLRKIGEGGMGQVFEAEQLAPVRRLVAVKLSRTGLSDERALVRFIAERQTLTRLDHPNIARILDAGTHIDGRPWFAMELVDGISIADWVNSHNLGFRERIELLLPVLDAVQHAHLKGIIHRDLKPSNILVSLTPDGTAKPRIIDFGIAKAIQDGTLDDAQVMPTQSGELLGTPEYMSPEQASLGAVDIDTRSDVYALGLVLFELLVGQLPLSLAQLRSFALDEMCRRIREDEPAKPSQLVQAKHQQRGSLSSAEWARRMRGDLDAVVLKALAKDRDQRYISASEFAADLRRFLADQPVLATQPHWSYRLRKWAKRNRALASAAMLTSLAIAIGTTLALYGYLQAKQGEQSALLAQEQAQATADFMVGLFQAADPRNEPGKDPSARELLARGVAQLNDPVRSASLSPSVRTSTRESLALASWALGDYASAEQLFTQALVARQSEQPRQVKRIAFVHNGLALAASGSGNWAQAVQHARSAQASLDSAGMARSPEGLKAANLLAMALRRTGDLAGAEQMFLSAITLTQALQPEQNEELASLIFNLSALQMSQGKWSEAIASQKRALTMFERLLPAGHASFAIVFNNMSAAQRHVGNLSAALALVRRARAIEEKNLPSMHPGRAHAMHNEASVLIRLGQLDAADVLLAQAIELLRQAMGPNHKLSWAHRDSQAEIALLRGKFSQAEQQLLALLEGGIELSAGQRLTSTRKLTLAQRGGGKASQANLSAQRYLELARVEPERAHEAQAELLLALIKLDAADIAAAQSHYARALTLSPNCEQSDCALDQAQSLLLRAHYLARIGPASSAIAVLQRALANSDWNASMLEHSDLNSLRAEPAWAGLKQALAQRLSE